jgi:hypothetical protein
MARYAEGLLYADGQKSGPSAYGPARPACPFNTRRNVAVGVATSTPRAALGISLALGVDRATPTATLGVGYFSNLSNFVKIITNSYDVRKMRIRYQNVQKNILYPFMSKSCIFESCRITC